MWGKRGFQRLFHLGNQTAESEMAEEIETHLALRTADLIRSGLSPMDARAEAEHRFARGGLAAARQELLAGARRKASQTRIRERWESIGHDFKLAVRQAKRAPAFTAVAVATFGLGIGATTATFTLVRSILLAPLPFPDSDRLVTLAGVDSLHRSVMAVSAGDWSDWQRESRSLASTALHSPRRVAVEEAGTPARVTAEVVSQDFFRVIGSRFVVGRPMTAAEVAAHDPVVIVSEGFWRRTLGAAPSLALPLTVDSRSFRVVGVVASGQEFPTGTELWIPARIEPEHGGMRNNINWQAIGRLASGATISAAAAELGTIGNRIRAAEPEAIYDYGVEVRGLRDDIVGGTSTSLVLLMGAVGLVLMVACANLAAVHLARGLLRRRETAVRAALGADRPRLAQQIVVEHGLTGLLGGLLGLGLALIGVATVVRLWGDQIPRAAEIHVDGWVASFAVIASLIAAVGTSLAPAYQATRVGLAGLIAAGGRGQVEGNRGLPGAVLLLAEVALAVVLLTGAGLLIRSFQAIQARELGFDPNVVTVSATLSDDRYQSSPTRRVQYWDALVDALALLPGAKAAGASNWVPLAFTGSTFVDVEGQTPPPLGLGYRAVSERFLDALGVPLIAGRWFGNEDRADGSRVVLVNARAAALCWPGQSPIGKRIRASSMEAMGGRTPDWLTVVGVVGDLRQWGRESDVRPEMYTLVRQIPFYTAGMTAVVRTRDHPERLLAAAREAAHRVDPSVAVEVGTLERSLADSLAPRRLTMSLLTGFGGFALLITAIGLYGVLSYSVFRRTRELALRAALGADRGHLLRIVAVRGLGLVAIGATVGLAAAAAVTRLMTALLVDITPLDPTTYLGVTAVLLLVAIAAMLGPALRAARLDPATALQGE